MDNSSSDIVENNRENIINQNNFINQNNLNIINQNINQLEGNTISQIDNKIEENENSLTYSIIHEYQKNDVLISKNLLRNKQTNLWIPDSSITHCHRCNVEFTMWIRKHHCRSCGNIFCFECTPFRKRIPKSLKDSSITQTENKKDPITKKIDEMQENTLQRLCYNCNDKIDLVSSLDVLIDVFSLVVPDMTTLMNMAKVCHLWYNLVQYFLGKIRNIQYKSINQSLTPLEKKLLWVNREYFIGHSHYTIAMIKSLDYDSYNYRNKQHYEFIKFLTEYENRTKIIHTTTKDITQKHMMDKVNEVIKKYSNRTNNRINSNNRIDCINLLCTKNCTSELKPSHAIIISDYCCRNSVCQELHDFCLKILQHISNDELFYYLPFLVDKLIYHRIDSSFSWGNFLIDRASNNMNIALELYWNLIYKERETHHAIYSYYLNKFFNVVNSEIVQLVNKSITFSKFLDGIPKTQDLTLIKSYFTKNNLKNCIVPMEPSLKINDVLLSQIHIKNSFTAPLLIPLICVPIVNETDTTVSTINYKILYKYENVRQDYLILKVIRLMKFLLHTYENLDIEIVDYHVCPLTDQTGLIQIVPNCKTAYEIKEKLKFTIWNYIVENNPHVTVDVLRHRFVKSCAAYCVITYLLGVGDRHLDNIMITKDGKLFHIDYGFVLGSDPKPLSQPKIRITQDMIDALGGYQSAYYAEFLKLCNRIYQGLRGHLNLFICLLSLLCQSDKEKYNKLVELLTIRFMPGETQKTAIVQLETELLRSTQQNIGETIVDFFHYHKQENTISNVISNTTNVLTNTASTTTNISKKLTGYVGNTLTNWWYNTK